MQLANITELWMDLHQMRVVLNAVTAVGAGVFAIHNLFGMNIGNAPDRVLGPVQTFEMVQ